MPGYQDCWVDMTSIGHLEDWQCIAWCREAEGGVSDADSQEGKAETSEERETMGKSRHPVTKSAIPPKWKQRTAGNEGGSLLINCVQCII